MFSTILSGAIYGVESYLVHVEVDISPGLPCFVMVGSLEGRVRESGERVRVALKNNGITIPPMHISVNLSPADIRKEGTGFDLPVALGLLTAMGKLPAGCGEGLLILGELGLNGELKPIKGVLPILLGAVKKGVVRCLVPEENVKEASHVPGMKAAGAEDLAQAMDYLRLPAARRDKWRMPQRAAREIALPLPKERREQADFCDIAGQECVKRAALIGAAGFHHMLILGPPGTGKTMIAKRIPTILPPLSEEESLEVSSLYSIAGKLPEEEGLLRERPFLSPHHTISPQALAGGGRIPRPGMISLAHRGVLFLDELPEFKRQTLDLLRQPLEDGTIHIARSGGSFTYPSDIMLVGAMNPCPCGYYPDPGRCRCTPHEIRQYLSHISGPVFDRIDLCVTASRVEAERLYSGQKGEGSESLRKKVMKARKIQEERYRGTALRFNSQLKAGDLEKYCLLGKAEREMLKRLYTSLELSIRALNKLLVVARTIADLEESERVLTSHLAEALCYRREDKLGRWC